MTRVAVVGAGLSGLAAARALRDAGLEVVVFEKSRGLGGRLASRRVGETVVDHGAPALDAAAGGDLARLAESLPGLPAVRVAGPVEGPPDPLAPMAAPVAWAEGLTQIAKRMAADLEVVRGVRIAAIRAGRAGLEIGDEQGNGHGTVDGVVVSAPAPQAADLLERSPEADRAGALRGIGYAPAVMAVVGARLGAEPGWFLRRSPLPAVAAVSAETAKGRPSADRVAPLVLRFTPVESAGLLDSASDDDVLAMAGDALGEILGADPDPAWAQVKRWRFALPESRLPFAEANPEGTRIVLCGDSVSPPGMEEVHASGIRAAAALLAALRR